MINPEENPEFLNDFLAYSSTILNKSENTLSFYSIFSYCFFFGYCLLSIVLHFITPYFLKSVAQDMT